MQTNLFIRRKRLAIVGASPTRSGIANCFGPDAVMLAAANQYPIVSLPDPLLLNWPNAVNINAAAALSQPGLQFFTNPTGGPVTQALRLTSVNLLHALSVSRYVLGEANTKVSMFNRWGTSNSILRFSPSLVAIQSSGLQTLLPLKQLVVIDGKAQLSDIVATSLAAAGGFDYAQVSEFDTSLLPSDTVAFEPTMASVLPSPLSASPSGSQFDPWADWMVTPDAPANQAYLGVVASIIEDFGFSIDPRYLDNVQNANNDLYIKIPYSYFGGYIASPLAGQPVLCSVSQPDVTGNYEGAFGYAAVPISALKASSVVTLDAAGYPLSNPSLIFEKPSTAVAQGEFPTYMTAQISASLSPLPPGDLLSVNPNDVLTWATVGPQ